MIVVDTNIISYLFIQGDYTKQVKALLKKDSNWVSPILWKSEFRSVLALYIRKRFLSLQQAKVLIEKAEQFMSGSEFQVNSNKVLELVQDSKCSAYDCEFVALARDLSLPLVTSDKKLIKEFPKIVLSVNQFLRL